MADRAAAVQEISARFAAIADALGLDGEPQLAYRPRSRATSAEELRDELGAHTDSDLERGFTGHGPHRDELATRRSGRELRAFGSQGQQRLALLALLLAEREAIGDRRSSPPVMLLDDVMSELDVSRRQALVDHLRRAGGQSVITATGLEQIPGSEDSDVTRLAVAGAVVSVEASAPATPADVAADSPAQLRAAS